MIPKWLWKLLDSVFHKLDKMLHDTTYLELDERCIGLSNRVDELEEENENLQDALLLPRTKKFRYEDF